MIIFDTEAYAITVRKVGDEYQGTIAQFPNLCSFEKTASEALCAVLHAIDHLKKIADEEGVDFQPPAEPLIAPFNKLTPAQSERLALLAEECGEVIQAIGKILRHGYCSAHPRSGLSNIVGLETELGDALAALELLREDLDITSILRFKKDKLERVKKYLHHN